MLKGLVISAVLNFNVLLQQENSLQYSIVFIFVHYFGSCIVQYISPTPASIT